MPLLGQLIVVLVLAAVGLWALAQFPALDATIVKVIRIVVIVCVVLFALNVLIGWFFHTSLFATHP